MSGLSARGFLSLPAWAMLLLVGLCVARPALAADEVIPPAPPRYFNDYASVISAPVARSLNAQLEQFERDTSSQIVVAIFPKMQSDSSIEDYTFRVAEAWKVGRAKEDNGAVLFIFLQDRAMFLQVGYGLEGALPDALAKNIIDTQIIPQIRQGNWDAALQEGVSAILAATRGEYEGTGRTVGQKRDQPGFAPILPLIFVILFLIFGGWNSRRGYGYGRRGYGPVWMGGFGGGRGGGGFGGFGGFSGGGGGFGGGGAGGRW